MPDRPYLPPQGGQADAPRLPRELVAEMEHLRNARGALNALRAISDLRTLLNRHERALVAACRADDNGFPNHPWASIGAALGINAAAAKAKYRDVEVDHPEDRDPGRL